MERYKKYSLQKKEKYKPEKERGVEPVSLVSKGISFTFPEKSDLEASAFNKRDEGVNEKHS